MSVRQSLRDRQASSEAAWALIIEGVSAARLEVHRLKHLVSRATKLVEKSKYREHLYQIAGDLINAIPERITQSERFLDRTSLALSKMGDEFLSARLPVSDKNMVDDAIEASGGFANGLRSPKSHLTQRVAQRYLKAMEPAENVAHTVFQQGYLPGGTKGQVPSISIGFADVIPSLKPTANFDGSVHFEGSLVFGGSSWEGGIAVESDLFKDFISYYPGKEQHLVDEFLSRVLSNADSHKAQVVRILSGEKLFSVVPSLGQNTSGMKPQNVWVGAPTILAPFVMQQESHIWVPIGIKIAFDLVG